MRRKPPGHLPAGRRTENRRRHPKTQRHPLRRQAHLLPRPALPRTGNPQKISRHVRTSCPPRHLFPAAGRHRPRVRVRAHRPHPHLRRMGAGRHRRTGHTEQERMTVFGGFFCIFADCEGLTPLHTTTQKQAIETETKSTKHYLYAKIYLNTGQRLFPVDQRTEFPLPQKPDQSGGKSEWGDAAFLLGTGKGYCGDAH